MKKIFVIGTLAAIVLAAFSLTGFVHAQTPTPPSPQTPYGRGMMGGGGMWNRSGISQYGPMHDYMVEALASALNVSEADLNAAFAQGQTMWQFAQAKGFTLEQIQQIMIDARQAAVAKMVEDGAITQAQADWMLSRMQGMWSQGQGGTFNGGLGCPGMGGGFGGRRGGRWSNPTNPPVTNPSTTNF